MQLDLIDPRPYQHKSILIITQTMQSIKNQYQQGNDQSAPPDINNNTKKNTKRLLLRLKRRRGAPLPETLCINPTNLNDSNSNDQDETNIDQNQIKRSRNETYLNPLQDQINQLKSDAYLSQMMMNMSTKDSSSTRTITSEASKSTPQPSKRPIVFKRFIPSSNSDSVASFDTSNGSNKKRKNDMVRVVDCLHEEEEADAFFKDPPKTSGISKHLESSNNSSRKRPRISILQTQQVNYHDFVNKSTSPTQSNNHPKRTKKISPPQAAAASKKSSPTKKKSTPILSPVMSLLDSQLKIYHESGPGLTSYMNFVETVILPSSKTYSTHLSLSSLLGHACTNGMGTFLHGAALWNDVEGASQFVLAGNKNLHIIDSDGRTAVDIAKMCGHESIVQIIQQFLGVPKENKEEHKKHDEQDFVYDLYFMDDIEESKNKKDESMTAMDSTKETDIASRNNDSVTKDSENDEQEGIGAFVELSNGIGYWDPNGDLIFETVQEGNENTDELNEDDDYDSNDEGFVGNDYPEEEEDEENYYYDEEGYYSDDNEDDLETWNRGKYVHDDPYDDNLDNRLY